MSDFPSDWKSKSPKNVYNILKTLDEELIYINNRIETCKLSHQYNDMMKQYNIDNGDYEKISINLKDKSDNSKLEISI